MNKFMMVPATSTIITDFFNKISAFATEFQTAGNAVLIAISLLILGSKFLIGDDETKARGRKSIPYIIIGAAIVISAFNIAASAGRELSFGSSS